MKKSVVVIFLLISVCSFSQNGKIYPKNKDIKPGEPNVYVYEPPAGNIVPENPQINLFYMPSTLRTVPLLKKDGIYEFSVTAPDSILVMLLKVTDQKRKTIDDNAGKGYVVYLKNGTKEESEKAILSKLRFCEYANYLLKLNFTPEEVISEFEALYAQNPALKQDESYNYYVELKYRKDPATYKPVLVDCAEKYVKKGDENSLFKAGFIYSQLKMVEKYDEINALVLKKYPKGKFAQGKFFNKFYETQDRTDTFIMNEINRFAVEFGDATVQIKDQFEFELLNFYIQKRDTLQIEKCVSRINNKLRVAGIFNQAAWVLTGEDLISLGKDLLFAERLSKQSIDIIKAMMDDPSREGDKYGLTQTYISYADTYALIMFKEKNYDLAFHYQDEISRMDEINPDGKERYALYAEKAKGLEFAKSYIESQLKSGVDSKIMILQLQDIYKKLNLPLSDFEKIKNNWLASTNQQKKEQIIKKYGSQAAIDFTLTNMEGKKVKLSDYKGKMIVLDFWATWCGPCRGSFPRMQELVKKYKNKNIEFFFVDVWEKKKPAETKKTVSEFITANKYTFQVLFDYQDDIVSKYKVTGIPSKFLIDKNGNMLFMEGSIDELAALIEENVD